MIQLLTYALSEGELVHVSLVKNGLACKCVCPGCGSYLVAKNALTNKKIPHFAHYKAEECPTALESAKHLLAKKILLETRQIKTPAYHHDYNPENEKSRWRESELITFDEVECEKWIDGFAIKADAVGIRNDRELYIEFAHTHFVDEDKRTKIKKTGIACIEIDLKDIPLEEEAMKTFFVSDSPLKYWIINPRRDSEYEKEQKKKRMEKEERKRLKILKVQEKNASEARRLEEYRKNKDYLILHDNEVEEKCPLRKEAIDDLKDSFYHHPVLRQIIDSNFKLWDGEIKTSYNGKGKRIYLNNQYKPVFVYPPDDLWKKFSEDQQRKSHFLYAGLKAIQSFLEEGRFGWCSVCRFSVDYIQKHEICSYPKK